MTFTVSSFLTNNVDATKLAMIEQYVADATTWAGEQWRAAGQFEGGDEMILFSIYTDHADHDWSYYSTPTQWIECDTCGGVSIIGDCRT